MMHTIIIIIKENTYLVLANTNTKNIDIYISINF